MAKVVKLTLWLVNLIKSMRERLTTFNMCGERSRLMPRVKCSHMEALMCKTVATWQSANLNSIQTAIYVGLWPYAMLMAYMLVMLLLYMLVFDMC